MKDLIFLIVISTTSLTLAILTGMEHSFVAIPFTFAFIIGICEIALETNRLTK